VRTAASLAVCSIVCGVLAAVAGARGTVDVTATVRTLSPTSRLVHIANHGAVSYGRFVVQSIRAPVISTATKPCVVERDLNFTGTTSNWRYRAICRKVLTPGKTFDIRLTTTGTGRIVVFVVVKGALVRISG
jgi:hypothetical protein